MLNEYLFSAQKCSQIYGNGVYIDNHIVGSVVKIVKAPFLRRPCDHDRVI